MSGTTPRVARAPIRNGLLAAGIIGLAAVIGWAFVDALRTAPPEGLAGAVAERLPESGVTNPVTAVLLNFRAYDTLLELAVLLVAVLGIRALGPARAPYAQPGAVFASLASWLVPTLIVVGGYLLWVGAHAPGGAFQAGALIAAAGVILRLAGSRSAGLPGALALRALLVGGVAVFLAVGLGVMLAGGTFLQYPVPWAGTLILVIEAVATAAIAATLVTAYLGGDTEALRPAAAPVQPSADPAPQPTEPPTAAASDPTPANPRELTSC